MEIIRWKGYDFADGSFELDVPFDQGRSQWMPVATTTTRRNANGEIIGISFSDRSITAIARHTGASPFLTWLQVLMGKLNPLDTTPGELVMSMDGGTTKYHCEAIVNIPSGYTNDMDVDLASVTWLTTDPLWHAETITTDDDVVVPATITNASFATNTTGWTKSADPTNVTSAFSRDAAVFSDSAGSGKLVVSANTAAGITNVYVLNDTEFACGEGEIIQVKCAVRTTNGQELDGNGVDAWPYIAFYSVADALLGDGDHNGISGQSNNVWETGYYSTGTAPANTSYCKIGAEVILGAGDTGTVYFDAFEFITGPSTSTALTVTGYAPTHLTLTATPAAGFPQSIKARTFTVTNNGDGMPENFPLMIGLGDNSASTINGTYWALLCEGEVLPVSITDYDTLAAYMWMAIERLAPGRSLDFTLLVSDQTIMPSTTFVDDEAPIIDTGSFYGTASGGAHSTTVTNTSGVTGDTDRWDEGLIIALSGVNAGLNRRISASTATSITHAAFPSANANTNSFLLLASHNGILSTADWIYAVRQTSRPSDGFRGLWYLDEWASKKPGNYGYSSPGSWGPYQYWKNNDVYGQAPFLKVGTDYLATLDSDRRWENGGDLDYRGYDGVSINMPFDITALKFRIELKNPNSMTTAILGSRQVGGAAEFVHEHENSTASTTLTTQSEQTITVTTGTRQLYLGQIPTTGTEIGETWAGTDGTASATTATTLTDSSAEWVTNQFVGGKITIVTGTNQTATITANTATAITVASWPSGTPTSTASYVIKNKPYVSTVRLVEEFRMTWDPTDLAISAVSAETDAYVLYRDILIDYNTTGDPYQRISINPATTGRYIVLFANESLVIDGETMRAWIADNTGAEVRTVPPQAYAVYDVEADGTERLADRWLWVTPGSHTISLASEAGVAVTIDAEWREALYG